MMLYAFGLIITIALILFKIFVKITTGFNDNYVCLIGKTALITGANSGIGFATALELAKRGARIILACRNKEEGEKAKNRIINETDNNNIICKHLDLASFKSIRQFASDINENENLDILINNAGGAFMGNNHTKDDYQMVMQTNYYGPFLLTHLLLPKLKKLPSCRIINVASIMAGICLIDVNNLDQYPKLVEVIGDIVLYSRSKLANVLFTIALSKRLRGTNVTVNVLNPGTVNTNVYRNFNYLFKIVNYYFVKLFCKTSEEGAQTTIYLATSKEVETKTGGFYVDCKECRYYWNVRKNEAEAIYEKTLEMLSLNKELI